MRLVQSLIVLGLISGPAIAETRAQKSERCAIQAGIVEAAIAQRQENRRQARATRVILKSDAIADTKYEANVDVLVAWVYSLPAAQMNEETVQTFEKACRDYKP